MLLCAQTDTRFWFAVPYLTPQHDNSLAAENSKLCFTSYDKPATITISQPGLTDASDWHYFAPYTVTLAANSTTDVQLAAIGINRAEYKKKVPYGILIESDEDISVYFAQTNANSEIYTLKGENALGTDFIVGMQNTYSTSWSGFASIEILATEDNTIVDITTPVPSANNPTGAPIQVTLNRGEVYTVVAQSAAAADHLSGTIIHANQPIAVNSTDDSVAASGQDLVGDQLVPNRLAGTEYIAVKHTGQAENLYIYALQNNTIFSVNGGVKTTINTRQTFVQPLSSEVNYIESNYPLVVFQLTGVGGELGGTQLPRLGCTGSSTVVYEKRFATQPEVVVLTHSDYTKYFTVNGSPAALTATDFKPVPGANDWSYCIKQLTPASNGLLKIHNDSTVFHLGVLDWGGGGTCTYGYFSDYNTEHLSATSGKSFYIESEPLQLSLTDADRYSDIVWTFADGSEFNGSPVNIPASLSYMGYVEVSAKSKNGCDIIQDTRRLALHILTPDDRDSVICKGEETTITKSVNKYGFNLLDTKPDTVTCSAPPAQIWKAVTDVEENQQYELALELSVANANRKPNLQIAVNGNIIGTINGISLTTNASTFRYTWTSTNKGRTEITVQTSASSVSGAVLNISKAVMSPVFPANENIHLKLTDTPLSEPILSSPTDSVYQGQTTLISASSIPAGVSCEWYKDGSLFAHDTLKVEGGEGEYTVTIMNADGCTESSKPLHIYTKKEVVPIEPTYPLTVELLTKDITLCDTEQSFDISYSVTEGDANLLIFNGERLALSGTGTEQLAYYGGPCDTVFELVFADTVHNSFSTPLKLTLHVLYSPLEIFTPKWGNTLAAYNSVYNGYGLDLTNWQWLQNGQEMQGENMSYLYLENGFEQGAVYQLRATFSDEAGMTHTMLTCPYTPLVSQQLPAKRMYNIYGTPVNSMSAPGVYIVITDREKQKVIVR